MEKGGGGRGMSENIKATTTNLIEQIIRQSP